MAILVLLEASDPLEGNEVAAEAGGDEFDNTRGDAILNAYNQSGADLEVHVTEQRACPYGDLNVHTSQLATVGAGKRITFGRFSISRYNSTFRRVEVTYPQGVIGLWVAARRRV
jgi:hypothetical protein